MASIVGYLAGVYDATCPICNEAEPDFYTRCGHYFHKKCINIRFPNGSEFSCSTCANKISFSQEEEYLEALKADHELCFTDRKHLELALKFMKIGHLTYDCEEKRDEILRVAQSFGL